MLALAVNHANGGISQGALARAVRLFVIIAWFCASVVAAQDSGALINALIRKGILSNQEAEDIRAELVRENNTLPAHALAGGKSTERLSVGMRLQMQFAGLETAVSGSSFPPPGTQHFFLRRMYLTLRTGLARNWGALFTYDFAAGGYDDAIIEWNPLNELKFDFGLRKVNVGYEERASSGNLRSIERSGVTRYFVEPNNGRRLGAASHHIGVFVDGSRPINKTLGLIWGAALTGPARTETFTLASSAGDATNNRPALWGNIGLVRKLPNNGAWAVGGGVGLLPDQGGFGTANLGRGFDLRIYSAYTDVTTGRFGLMAEYLTAHVEAGRAIGGDAWPRGFFVQPTVMLTGSFEAVLRYQWLNSDRRGVNLADVIRSAPAGGTMNRFTEWYAGLNWYLRGNDLKLQLGGINGETSETVTGNPAQAKTVGVRSQMQMQF